MTSAKLSGKRLFWAGLGGLFAVALLVFTFTIGGGQPSGPAVMLALAVATLGVVAHLLLQSARALVQVGAEAEEREQQAKSGRRRKELEREYYNLKRALKELELDHAMGKLSESDYGEIRGRYRERAVRVLRQLDQGESYRQQIERDLQARRQAREAGRATSRPAAAAPAAAPAPAAAAAPSPSPGSPDAAAASAPPPAHEQEPSQPQAAAVPADEASVARACASCGAANDADAVFCKKCGVRINPS